MNIYDLKINHPGRSEALQYFDNHCTAATPPSKGGETFTILSYHKTTLRLTAMVLAPRCRGAGSPGEGNLEPGSLDFGFWTLNFEL